MSEQFDKLDELVKRLRATAEGWPGGSTSALCREAADCIASLTPSATASASLEVVPVAVLRNHWLHQIECDHETKRDRPICSCSRVNLGWHENVGTAVEAWIGHITSLCTECRGVGGMFFTGCTSQQFQECGHCGGSGVEPSRDDISREGKP